MYKTDLLVPSRILVLIVYYLGNFILQNVKIKYILAISF
jgi:hypothetical protein